MGPTLIQVLTAARWRRKACSRPGGSGTRAADPGGKGRTSCSDGYPKVSSRRRLTLVQGTMAAIVLVHGIAQEQRSADSLEKDWIPDLAGGIRKAGFSDLADRLGRDRLGPAGLET